jgi:hypothetical protein
VELRFAAPDLASLDGVEAEVLACCVTADERPSHGVAGLCDFRMAGRISALERRGFVRGDIGEVVLLSGRPRLRFDKVLLFGAGARATFDEDTFRTVLARMLVTFESLGVRSGVVELPGRHAELIAPERAADILLASAARASAHDVWTLVEGPAARQRIVQHMIEERRRVRRVL